MYKLEIKLKQHTPIIHFQHDQEGATLRATELKPKLDRYLIEHAFGNDFNAYKKYLIGYDSRTEESIGTERYREKIRASFNYRLKIINDPNSVKIKRISRRSAPMFFGDIGEDRNNPSKKLVHALMPVIIEISSFYKDLLNFLNAHISGFFNYTSFGTRQNKGYGAFSVISDGGKLKSYPLSRYIQFTLPENNGLETLFTVIQYYYQRLKSGINYCFEDENRNVTQHYHHSFLKIYYSNNYNGRWEKAWVKRAFIDHNIPAYQNEKFVRPYLGLPTQFFFLSNARNRCNHHNRHRLPRSNKKISIEDSGNNSQIIDRIPSSLRFFPIIEDKEVRVFIFPDPSIKIPINHQFKFSSHNITEYLATPNHYININDLVNQYHNHLGNNFTAYNFTGQINIQVNVH